MTTRHAADSAPARGLFIALDGPDGGGKTTQAARLVDWLRGRGREVIACRDPGGTALGDRLRAILLDRDEVEPVPWAETLLYMASRAQLVEQVIRPALEAGRDVVADRYLLANLVYQGYAGGLPMDAIWRVGEAATGGLLPNLTLLIDVPPAVAKARVGAARDRMEDRPDAFREKVRAGFLRLAEMYPSPIIVVDGAADADAVAACLRSEVEHALGVRPRP